MSKIKEERKTNVISTYKVRFHLKLYFFEVREGLPWPIDLLLTFPEGLSFIRCALQLKGLCILLHMIVHQHKSLCQFFTENILKCCPSPLFPVLVYYGEEKKEKGVTRESCFKIVIKNICRIIESLSLGKTAEVI